MKPADFAALKAQLKEHEGVRLRVYEDSLGIPTIGIGRNLRDKGISLATAEQMLDEDIDECYSDLLGFAWFPKLDSIRMRAVLDLRFNLGPHRFRRFKRMLTALEAGDYTTAAHELFDSAWWGQVQKSRRERLHRMLKDGRER